MNRLFSIILLFTVISVSSFGASTPSIYVHFEATASDGESASGNEIFEGSAPIEAQFFMQLYDTEDWSYNYEWRFCHQGGNLDEPYMIRYEESPQVTFSDAMTDSIALYITFIKGNDTIRYTRAYWSENEAMRIKASESSLTFPNAFSPNGDSYNDTYKPKSYQSIVEFKAVIFSRWGQKLYEWNDVTADGWDGKFNGKDVADGTYYVLVKARGADGRQFTIKKDVNLLRSYNDYSNQ